MWGATRGRLVLNRGVIDQRSWGLGNDAVAYCTRGGDEVGALERLGTGHGDVCSAVSRCFCSAFAGKHL